jgi:hypothetical protein
MTEHETVSEGRDIQSHPRRTARWVWILAAALLFVVAAISYVVFKSTGDQTAANPPAVLATPSAVPGVPPPAPQTTTGTPAPATGQPQPR